ncbi:hypothetical protein ACFQU2_39890 [Siccirubricoccus deserti]
MADWQDRLAVIAQRNRQEIVNAKLSRREMMRLGLLTSTGSLVLKAGLSARAHAQTALIPPSPAATSWAQPMPVLPIKTPVAVNQLTHGAPDGTTLIDGARRRINHQLCSRNADGTYGGTFPPQKFYETFVREADHKFHPSWAPSKIWGSTEPTPDRATTPITASRSWCASTTTCRHGRPMSASACRRSPPTCTTPIRHPRATATRPTSSTRSMIPMRSIRSASRISTTRMSMPATPR